MRIPPDPEADAIHTPTITQKKGRKDLVTLPLVTINDPPGSAEIVSAIQLNAKGQSLSFYMMRMAYKAACVGLIQPTHLFASEWVIDYIETVCKPYDYRRTHELPVNGRPCNVTPAGFPNFFWAAKTIPWGSNDAMVAFFTHRPKTPQSENSYLHSFNIGVCLAKGFTLPEFPVCRARIIELGLRPLIEDGKWKTWWAIEPSNDPLGHHNVFLSAKMNRQMAKMIDEGVWGEVKRNSSGRLQDLD